MPVVMKAMKSTASSSSSGPAATKVKKAMKANKAMKSTGSSSSSASAPKIKKSGESGKVVAPGGDEPAGAPWTYREAHAFVEQMRKAAPKVKKAMKGMMPLKTKAAARGKPADEAESEVVPPWKRQKTHCCATAGLQRLTGSGTLWIRQLACLVAVAWAMAWAAFLLWLQPWLEAAVLEPTVTKVCRNYRADTDTGGGMHFENDA
jgi:hypothetical protein